MFTLLKFIPLTVFDILKQTSFISYDKLYSKTLTYKLYSSKKLKKENIKHIQNYFKTSRLVKHTTIYQDHGSIFIRTRPVD